jgi:hypothetical protein
LNDLLTVMAHGTLPSNLEVVASGGRRSYKADEKHKQTRDHLQTRRCLLVRLREVARERYGVSLYAPDELCVDPTGDHLDALICAVQAAWAWLNRKNGFGVPAGIDSLEGWIAEPTLGMPVGKLPPF